MINPAVYGLSNEAYHHEKQEGKYLSSSQNVRSYNDWHNTKLRAKNITETWRRKQQERCLSLIGHKYGRLTVLDIAEPKIRPNGQRVPMLLCRCDCGKDVEVCSYELTGHKTISCGCYRSEANHAATHRQTGTRLHRLWINMRQRCRDSHTKSYNNYGGRGIKVCGEWDSFERFKEWAESEGWDERKSGKEQSLDRIDVNGNYCPENCRFVSMKKQENNRRNTPMITYHGETLPIGEMASKYGLKRETLYDRIIMWGWTVEDAIEKPIDISKRRKNYE